MAYTATMPLDYVVTKHKLYKTVAEIILRVCFAILSIGILARITIAGVHPLVRTLIAIGQQCYALICKYSILQVLLVFIIYIALLFVFYLIKTRSI